MADPTLPKDPDLPRVTNFEVIEVEIHNQVGTVFKGVVKAISSANDKGEFSILPGHTNFVSLIKKPVILYPQEGKPRKFEVGLGVLRCLYNKVDIFTGLLVNKESEILAAALGPSAGRGSAEAPQIKAGAAPKPEVPEAR